MAVPKKSFGGNIKTILILALMVRLILMLVYPDLHNDNYFEFGEIARQILAGRGFSFYSFENGELNYLFDPALQSYPSAWMPPGYVIFILPFMMIDSDFLRNILLMLVQTGLSLVSIYLLYVMAKKLFSEKIALFAAGLAALLPDFVYAPLTWGSTIFYHIAVMLLFILIYEYDKSENFKTALKISIIFAVLILFRMEVALLIAGTFLLFLSRGKWKHAVLVAGIVSIVIIPWLARNYAVFGRPAPPVTSGGINFYRGHNPYRTGVWGTEEDFDKLKEFKGKDLELRISDYFREQAFKHIKKNPKSEIVNNLEKLLYFWTYNPYERKTSNIAYLVTWFPLLFLIITGIIKHFSWSKYKYFYIFIIYHTLLVILFFPLTRYQTMMKIALLPFAAQGFFFYYELIRNRLKRV